eukprot:CAMPEP_0202967004 /NCGR_PEP_ID=MMETSP1396-20130829/11716_1 /ASSEMBLY_ACC=CAM_ASM_000872 /TAXON_ID= /ORGANISM="Pseudokeronopsis sp., Strain Brazil" /LENGTH=51 /DNA_ID=CAMNT_0049691565 /DNA_START=248 /DNA_END=400 /DNA_ORIENTATION=-
MILNSGKMYSRVMSLEKARKEVDLFDSNYARYAQSLFISTRGKIKCFKPKT